MTEDQREAKRAREARARYAADPKRHTDKARRLKFGVTPEAFEAMKTAQGNACAICRTETPRGKGDWHVDHDHVTGRVRGLLCQNCNIGLGNFRDDPSKLAAAITYLTTLPKHGILEL